MQLPTVFIRNARHVHHAPYLTLASVIATEHVDQLGRIDWIALNVLVPAVDFDGAGVDDDVVDTHLREGPVQPETVTPRFVAGVYRRVLRQIEACLGFADLLDELVKSACRHRAKAWLLRRLRSPSLERGSAP